MHGHGEMLAVPSGMQCVFSALLSCSLQLWSPSLSGLPILCLAKMSQTLGFH